MLSLFEQLLDYLQQIKSTASDILAVSQLHLEALKKNKSDNNLRVIVAKQEALIGKLAKIQKICSENRAEIGKKIGMPEDEALSSLLVHAPDNLKDGLTAVIEELKVLFAEIQDTNDINKMLTQNALAFNEQLIKIFLPTQSQTYKGDGVVDRKQPAISRLNLSV